MRRFSSGRRNALMALGTLLAVAPLHALGQDEPMSDDLGLEPNNPLTALSAAYQALASYSDAGTVETRYQWPGTDLLVEQHRFETAWRAPRHFFFRFIGGEASGGDQYVIWCNGGDFESWWKTTGVHTVHDNGTGATAFFNGQSPSHDAANLVAPHLFPQALLVGPTYRLIDPVAGDPEAVAGQPCRTFTATARVTGTQTIEHRPIKLWIDEALGLVRQVQVDAERDSPAGLIDQTTYRLEPRANPSIPDEAFTFTPPQG